MRFVTLLEKPCYNCLYSKQSFFMGKRILRCMLYPSFINTEKLKYVTYETTDIVRKTSSKCGEYGRFYKCKSLVER